MVVRGEHVSVIAAISSKGLLDLKIHRGGAVDSDIFCDFVTKQLLPHLYPFNGSNPHSVVVLDNCSIRDSITALQECGALVHYLPAYSPDYNPIENIFSKVKNVIKQVESYDTSTDINELILKAFTMITPSDCFNSIINNGIYNE